MYQQTHNHSFDTQEDKTNIIKMKCLGNISRNSTIFTSHSLKHQNNFTHEYFTEFCPCEHFKTSAKLHYQAFLCVCG